MTPELHSSTVT